MFQSIILVASITLVSCIPQHVPCNQYPDFKLMNTKTDYDLVGNITNFDEFNLKSTLYYQNVKYFNFINPFFEKIQDYEIIGFWHLSRHGHRYPGRKSIEENNKLLLKIQNSLTNQGS